MARINLLPWRQEERKRRNKEFTLMIVAAVAVSALISLMLIGYFKGQLSSQQSANTTIENENKRLDEVIKEIEALETQKNEMVERMKVIQDLQGRRSVPVRVWDDIARAIPQHLYLVSIKREGETLTLNGFADNNHVVSQLVRNLDASAWLKDSRIPQIKTKVQAYESAATISQNASKQDQNRPILPEDGYVEFTVTTQIQTGNPKDNEQAAQPQDVAVPATPAEPAQAATPAPEAAPAATPTDNAAASAEPAPVIADTTGEAPPPQQPEPASVPAEPVQATAGGQ